MSGAAAEAGAPATTDAIIARLHEGESRVLRLIADLQDELTVARRLAAELILQNAMQAEQIERLTTLNQALDAEAQNIHGALHRVIGVSEENLRVHGEVAASLAADREKFHAERPAMKEFEAVREEPPPRPSERDIKEAAQKAVALALGGPE